MKTADIANLREELMGLPPTSRALLAQDLLASLDAAATEHGVEEEWATEADRRLDELESNVVKGITGDEVLREVRSRRV